MKNSTVHFKKIYKKDLEDLNKQHLKDMVRVDFYIGNLVKSVKPRNDELLRPRSLINRMISHKPWTWFSYQIPLLNKLNKYKLNNNKLLYKIGDIQDSDNSITYSLLKNRPRETPNDGVILRCLNFSRHWKNYYNRPNDLQFENKFAKIIWRGVTTGSIKYPGNRFDLVKKWFGKNPKIDVGFSKIVQSKEKYKKYLSPAIDIEEMLKYKYILSVEGNDKDSGLQWKLNSNSVVLMTKPRITSWLMETTLIPDYHYVLIKDDYSDLEEKLNWCNNNQDKCLIINQNAREFMKQFDNNETEERIEEKVLKKYFDLIK